LPAQDRVARAVLDVRAVPRAEEEGLPRTVAVKEPELDCRAEPVKLTDAVALGEDRRDAPELTDVDALREA